jgi:4-amino-4-deoxy-L-arabinose transferase-like glycosyltransferase
MARRGLLLLGLVVLCLLPRAAMAWKMSGICPDAILYFRLAECLDEGRLHEALATLPLNLYPVILMLLHRAGLPWEFAGTAWGVLISSCTVLPLYGWVRRQFDDRVALAAGLVYALHQGLVRWSPEIIRDPTFWFLFSLGLYLMWRAIAEGRRWLFLAAGLAVTLACLTRFEALVLLIPLGLWSLGRFRACPQLRRRLLVGVTLSIAVFPMLLTLGWVLWFRGEGPSRLVRLQPLELAGTWARSGPPVWHALRDEGRGEPANHALRYAQGRATPYDVDVTQPPPPASYLPGAQALPLAKRLERFWLGLVKGMTPLFLLISLGGLARWRHVWKRWDYQPLFYSSLVILLAIWVHLWWSDEAGQRYFLPVAVMSLPFAALGLMECSEILMRLARHVGWVDRSEPHHRNSSQRAVGLAALDPPYVLPSVVAVLPAALFALTSLVLLAGLDCRFRAASVELGHWAGRQFGPSPLLLGPEGVVQVVGYYGRGRCESFRDDESDGSIIARAGRLRPDLVLLPAVRKLPGDNAPLLGRIEDLGFQQVDRSQFSGGCRKVLVLARCRPAEQVASGEWRVVSGEW